MNKLLGVLLASILVLSGTVIPASAETLNGTDTISRLSGQDRYQTSVAIAEAYNNGLTQNVILASGNDFPDALSASILSKKLNAPILLVNSTANGSNEAFSYIQAHVSNTGTVYIIGGTSVIGSGFETKLTSMGYSNIKRLGGTDRYTTDMLIVNKANVPQGTPIFIASGENFPDALSVSSFSGSKQYPILLVGENTLPAETENYIMSDKPSAVFIAGGTSVVSQNIESQIKALVPSATVTRLAGDDRFATNAAVLNEYSSAPETLYLANGDNFPDALAGGSLAAKTGDPILLVDNRITTLPPAIEAYVKKLNGSGIQPNVIALGGTSVVSNLLVQQVKNVLDAKPQVINSKIASAADSNTAYYLDSSGHVWAWGSGKDGELGNGTTTAIQSTPVEVSNLFNITAIAGSQVNGYALDNSGHVWAWGGGVTGELGNGTTKDSSVPVQVSNLTNIISIAAGGFGNGYALDNSGHVWAWGEGSGLSNGTGTNIQSTPVQIPNLKNIVAIAAGNGIASVLDKSGNVWTWGLGVPGSTSAPVQIPNLSNIVAIAAGPSTDYALDNSGHVWEARYGIVNTPNNVTTGISSTPIQVPNLSNIVTIAAGIGSDYALDKSGKVWTWDGTNQNTPDLSNLTDIVAIAGGNGTGYALDSSGRVWAWGLGYYGALGNGTTKDSNVPVQVLGLPK
jgi:alpha-tubulin suppressor-like RCC1 family protein/putative cell wall-binding protein